MLFIVALYFVLATLALALLLLPQARAQAVAWAQRLVSGGVLARRRVAEQGQKGAQLAAERIGTASQAGFGWVAERRTWILAGFALLIAGPLLALAFQLRGFLSLDGYDHRVSRSVNDQVAMLLKGEQLVPPPPLPPQLFMTAEIERVVPMISVASRQWELLDADFRQRMLVVFKLMHDQHGIDMVLLEGYRSPERQARLAALGPNVTRAG
ncbi:MAG: M15 family peptidase, partial [Caldimonas sp.]